MKLRIAAVVAVWFAALCQAQDSATTKLPQDAIAGPPVVSAKAWGIGDARSGELLWSRNAATPRQVASTTKMMTAWIVLELARSEPGLLDEIIVFSERADRTGGTTAGVRAGEKISVANLLYGLLLPSGNDAAVALGEHFGRHFQETSAADRNITSEVSLKMFVEEMNRRANHLGMEVTHYYDPHGNSRNQSCARDLLRLAHTAMRNPAFRKYVNTAEHTCEVTTPRGETRTLRWSNTNELLRIEGFDGIKTGRTGGAGGCLVSRGQRGGKQLIVVVLGSASADGRFVDSRNLYRWAWQQLDHQGHRELNASIARLESELKAIRIELSALNNTLGTTTAKSATKPEKNKSLDIRVENHDDWKGAPPENIRAVCLSAAQEIWKHFPNQTVEPIVVRHAEQGPMVVYGTGPNGERRVLLNVGGTYWAQFAFQFAHEFCHIMCRYREAKNPNLWFEESLCEAASLFALRRMAETWKTKPPYSNWAGYSTALSDYAENRIKATRKLEGMTLAEWYRENEPALRKTGTDRAKNQIVAIALLALFDKNPEDWASVRFLNQWDKTQELSFEGYLLDWYRRLPVKHKPFAQQVAGLFEISIE